MINNSTKIKLIKKAKVTDIAGEKVIIDFETGKYILIKGSGNAIWDMLEDGISVEEIVNKLTSEYEIDNKTCMDEVVKFLENLREYKFIEMEE